jgi:hypothetical protein
MRILHVVPTYVLKPCGKQHRHYSRAGSVQLKRRSGAAIEVRSRVKSVLSPCPSGLRQNPIAKCASRDKVPSPSVRPEDFSREPRPSYGHSMLADSESA